MSALRLAWHAWLAVGPLSVGYWAGRRRPWLAFGDWLLDRCDRPGNGWRQWYLVPLAWVQYPKTLPYSIKWACGWRPPEPPPRPVVPLVDLGLAGPDTRSAA